MRPPLRQDIAPIDLAIIALLALAALMLWVSPAAAAGGDAARTASAGSDWLYAGAAIAAGVATLGAGYAVARVGTAAVGALAEKPELFGRLLIFIGLAEGIAIYGLIVAILMLNKAG